MGFNHQCPQPFCVISGHRIGGIKGTLVLRYHMAGAFACDVIQFIGVCFKISNGDIT